MSCPVHASDLIREMNRYYDHRAPWHDDYMSYTDLETQERYMKPIIESFLNLITGRRLLEVACGTGNWTQILAKHAASVTATDNSPESLAIARKKISGNSNISFSHADAYQLTEVDGTFDVVFAADWWSHIPLSKLPTFLRSVSGKLAPGSSAIFIDMFYLVEFDEEPCHTDCEGNRVFLRTLPDGSQFEVVKNFPERDELTQALAPFFAKVDYYEFADMKRWMVIGSASKARKKA